MAAERFFPRAASGLVRTISPHHALMFAVLNMLIGGSLFIAALGTLFYPGNYLPASFLLVIPPSLFVAFLYIMMSVAMPRTGGDYIWVGRILHPALGFLTNFYLTFLFLSFIGFIAPLAWNLVISDTVISVGIVTGNEGLIALGQSFADPMMGFYVAAVIILAAGLLPLLGTKASTKILIAMFSCNLIAYALLVLTLLAGGREAFIAGFNAKAGIEYTKVIDAAKAGGAMLTFALAGTIYGMVGGYQNSWGYHNSAYIVGELKAVRLPRAQTLAVLGALCTLILLGAGMFATVYYVAGPEFWMSIVWAWAAGDPSYTIPYAMPTPLGLLAFMTDNVPLIWLTGILWFIGFVSFPFTVVFVFSRNFFAWSFDRVLPARFSNLSKRTGAPWMCIILAIIVAEVWNYAFAWSGLPAYVVYMGVGWGIAWVIVGLAGVLFPYLRKDIFEASPEFVKKKLGKVPLVSIFGAATMVWAGFMAYASALPEITGILPLEAVVYSVLFIVSLMVAGPVIYAISYAYHKRKGIELHLAHRQLPVE